MVTKTAIVQLHLLKPGLTAGQLAGELGCRVEQIFSVKQRCGLKIPRAKGRAYRPNNVFELGREARRAGLTVDKIRELGPRR